MSSLVLTYIPGVCLFPPAPVLPLGGRMSLCVVAPRVSSVLDWALVL